MLASRVRCSGPTSLPSSQNVGKFAWPNHHCSAVKWCNNTNPPIHNLYLVSYVRSVLAVALSVSACFDSLLSKFLKLFSWRCGLSGVNPPAFFTCVLKTKERSIKQSATFVRLVTHGTTDQKKIVHNEWKRFQRTIDLSLPLL